MGEYDGKIRVKTELDNSSIGKLKEKLADLKEDAQNIGTNQKNIDAFIQKFELFKDSYNDAKKSNLFENDINSLNILEQEIREVVSTAFSSYNNEWFSELDSLVDRYNEIKNSKIFTDDDVAEAEAIKEKVKEMVKELEKSTGIKLNIKGITDESEKAKFNFKEIGNHLMKVGISLLGVRSIFSSLSKASNAYLSQHTETSAKLQSIWTALGNLIGPIIEMVANGILKLVGYLNVFINALGFKIDLTKGMNKNTKAINNTTKAMKELNNQTYAFDEMNIVQDNSSSSSGLGSAGIDSSASTFKMPELDPKIVKTLEDMAKWLKENWDWIWKVGAALGAVFGIAKIGGWLSNIGKLMGVNGLSGLLGILKPLAAIGVVVVGVTLLYNAVTGRDLKEDLKDIYDGLTKLPKANDDVAKAYEGTVKEAKRVNDANLEVAMSYEKGSDEIERYVNALSDEIDSSKNTIKNKEKEKKSSNLLEAATKGLTHQTQKANEIKKQELQHIINNVEALEKLAQENKLTDEQTKIYTESVEYLTKKQGELKDEAKELMLNMLMPENVKKDMIERLENTYNQIEALKKNKDEYTAMVNWEKAKTGELNNYLTDMFKKMGLLKAEPKLETNNQKAKANDLFTTFKTKLSEIGKLKAEPTVEIKADTKKLSSVFETLSKSNFLGGGLMSSFLTTANKLKSLGMDHGGIFNLPGRGIPIGANVVVGEKRREGVLPLEDASTMAELGYEIGKNVVVNLTNENYLNNRLIGRESKRVSNQTAYLTNGRVM